MTEQEAQQAQTIAEDRKKRDAESWETYLHEQSRSYPEDLLDIDHGAYRNICSTCGKSFQGFKRRFICRVCKIANLKSIVDSQAQKIVELERENLYLKRQADIHNTLMADGAKFILENKAKIAEHAKEIERLKDCMFQHMDSDTYNHCQEYLEKMRGKNENKTANEIDDV